MPGIRDSRTTQQVMSAKAVLVSQIITYASPPLYYR